MTNRSSRPRRDQSRRGRPTPSIVVALAALLVALSGTAVAANSLIHARDIARGAVTSRAIRNGGVELRDLSSRTQALLLAGGGKGETGPSGTPGTNGANGANGANGPNGVDGNNGLDGAGGINGVDGTNGLDGADGADGVDGTNGADGSNGTDGTNGTNGTDGTITPLSAKQGLTALPTASPPTIVVELAVPAGSYVVLAKTQLSHTGAGDSIDCTLKAGVTTIDQVAMKTLPALAALPVSMQAVATTATPSQLSVECKVQVANGSADFSSLIALPTA